MDTEFNANKLPTMILVDGRPVSECCRAEVFRKVDYTDTHVFAMEEAETDESGKVTYARYRFMKTYDGIDGEDAMVYCSQCELPINDLDVDFDELRP